MEIESFRWHGVAVSKLLSIAKVGRLEYLSSHANKDNFRAPANT